MRVCLDDVGTSDENLVMLTRGNINMVKLDKLYADRMLDPDWSLDSIKGFVAVARSSTVQVVAEGIETQFQKQFLQQAGCEIAQGFLLDKPMPADDFIARLKPATQAYAFHPTPPSSKPQTPRSP